MARNEAIFILRDKMEKPKGVLVVLEMDEDSSAFGISLLSDKDRWKYKTGVKLAMNRAISCIKEETAIKNCAPSLNFSDIYERYIVRDESKRAIFNLCWKHYIMICNLLDLSIIYSKAGIVDYNFINLIHKMTKESK